MAHRVKFSLFCLLVAVSSLAQSTYNYRYWFDHDREAAQTGNGSGSQSFQVDVSQLGVGLHQINIELFTDEGDVTSIRNSYFYRTAASDAAMTKNVTCYYAFDHETEYTEAMSMGNGTYAFDTDVSRLCAGIHQMNVRIVAANGEVVSSRNSYFYKTTTPDAAMREDVTCYYAFDHETEYTEAMSMGNGTYAFDTDVSRLCAGIHQMNVRIVAANGEVVSSRNSYFYRTVAPEASMREDVTCYYAFDHEAEYIEARSMADGTYSLDLDVNGLGRGMHTLNVRIVAANGEVVSSRNSFFLFSANGTPKTALPSLSDHPQ